MYVVVFFIFEKIFVQFIYLFSAPLASHFKSIPSSIGEASDLLPIHNHGSYVR